MSEKKKVELAERVRTECIKAAKEGFLEASMSGLYSVGAMEAAISAMQIIDIKKITEEISG